VGLHRHHHKFSDQPNDHHDAGRGLWWSHSDWMLHDIPSRFARSSAHRRPAARPLLTRWLDRWFLMLQLPLGAASGGYGERAGVPGGGLGLGALGDSITAWLSSIHVTWLVNSATHAFGYRNFDSPICHGNCWWVAILSFGEGGTTTTHAHPSSARHGLRWFEFDLTWQHIRLLQWLGLARARAGGPATGPESSAAASS